MARITVFEDRALGRVGCSLEPLKSLLSGSELAAKVGEKIAYLEAEIAEAEAQIERLLATGKEALDAWRSQAAPQPDEKPASDTRTVRISTTHPNPVRAATSASTPYG